MSAKDIIRGNKTSLLEILSGDHMLILNKVQELSLISDREYKNLKRINNENVEGHLGELLDKLMNKGDETCQDFINLLKTDDMIQKTFPNLKSIQWTVDNSEKQTQIQCAWPGQQEAKFQQSAGQIILLRSSNTELKMAPLKLSLSYRRGKRKLSASNEPGPSSGPHSAAKKPKRVAPKAKENGHNTQTVPKKKEKKPKVAPKAKVKKTQTALKKKPKVAPKAKVKKTQTALKKTNNVPKKVASKAKGKKTQTALSKNKKNKPSSSGLGTANKKPNSKKGKKAASKAK